MCVVVIAGDDSKLNKAKKMMMTMKMATSDRETREGLRLLLIDTEHDADCCFLAFSGFFPSLISLL